MTDGLPEFRYHPDPVGTGSVEPSDAACECCGQARGHRYTGPTYAVDVVEDLCPWCIADGSAAERFDATFTDLDGDVPPEVLDVVARRTPAFSTWQQGQWLCHCGDACAFLGPVGHHALEGLPAEAAEAVVAWARSEGGMDEAAAASFAAALHRDGDASAYLFRCLHCGQHLAYADFT